MPTLEEPNCSTAHQEIALSEGDNHGLGFRVHTACDLKQYSARDHSTQLFMVGQLDRLLSRVAERAKVEVDPQLVQNRGDGSLNLWPTSVSTMDIVTRYLPALYEELVALNKFLADGNHIQMRLAIAAGTSERTPDGTFVGAAVIAVSRLVESEEIREGLTGAGAAPLIVLLDDPVYQDLVSPKVAHLNPMMYRRIKLKNKKKNFARTAWMTVPGQPSVGPVEKPHDRRGWSSWPTPVKVAAITGAATVLAAAITAGLTTANRDHPNPQQPTGTALQIPTTNSATSYARSTSASSPTGQSPTESGSLYDEIAANRRGVPTFADTSGTAPSTGAIPYGTTVKVSCVAPNTSGMSSINAFYRIESGTWRGTYAPANTFANGDPLGTAGTHNVDAAVPPC